MDIWDAVAVYAGRVWYNYGDFSPVVTGHSAITTFTTENVTSLLSLLTTVLLRIRIRREGRFPSIYIFTPDRYRVSFWTRAKLIMILTYSHKKSLPKTNRRCKERTKYKMTVPWVLSWLSCVYSWLGFSSKLQIIPNLLLWQSFTRRSAELQQFLINTPIGRRRGKSREFSDAKIWTKFLLQLWATHHTLTILYEPGLELGRQEEDLMVYRYWGYWNYANIVYCYCGKSWDGWRSKESKERVIWRWSYFDLTHL